MDDRSPDPAEELDALLEGRYSEVPDDLAPLIDSAELLRAATQAYELEDTVAAAHLQRIAGAGQAQAAAQVAARGRSRWPWQRRIIAIGLAAVLACIPPVVVAGSALPGEPLYPLKRMTEHVRLLTAVAPEREAAERTRLAVRRCEEFERLTTAGDRAHLGTAKVELRHSLLAARAAIAHA